MPKTYEAPAHEYFQTPDWAVIIYLDAWAPTINPPTNILEPAAGGRALLGPLRRAWPNATIDPRDIELQPGDEGIVKQSNFWLDDAPERFDLCISNPPFSIAETFVRQSLTKVRAWGYVSMLLPLGFLCSQERAGFRAEVGLPLETWALASRPSFKGNGTDSRDCGWMVWRRNAPSPEYTKLRVL